jgi:hypothetical protein
MPTSLHKSFQWRPLLRLSGIVIFCLFLCISSQHVAMAQSPNRAVASTAFSKFAGKWSTHGGLLTVTQDGHVGLNQRTYVFCNDPGVKAPCDTLNGNQIQGGIVKKGVLTSINGNTATGTIIDSTTGDKGQLVSLVLSEDDTVKYEEQSGSRTYCGPDTSNALYYCGA